MPFRFTIGIAVLVAGISPVYPATFGIADGDVAGLQAAINTANSNNQDDMIFLAVGGTYEIDRTLPTIGPDNGHSLSINGNNATLYPLSGFFFYTEVRFFEVNCFQLGVSNGVDIRNMTLRGGSPQPDPGDVSYGGAIRVDTGTVSIAGCTFYQNFADWGSAISNSSTLAVYDSTFNGNNASLGAIFNRGNLTVNGCTFVENYGGVLFNRSEFNFLNVQATFNNCTLSNNSGKAILNNGWGSATPRYNATVTLIGCTLSHSNLGNESSWIGDSSPPDLTINVANTILADSAFFNTSTPANPSQRILSNGYNLSNGDGNGFLTNIGDQLNTDPKLDPAGLQYNGGITKTFALLEGSPAIDNGKQFGVTFDQRGQPRPTDFAAIPNAAGGDGSDIGAYEAADFLQADLVNLVVNRTSDHDDGVCGVFDCTLREANSRANVISGDNTISFAPGLTGTIVLGSALDITTNVAINGPGARAIAVSGNGVNRVFSFDSGTTSAISGLTIGAGLAETGGGLYNLATLTVNDCLFNANHAQGAVGFPGFAGFDANGGAIYNGGALSVSRSTFSANTSTGGMGGFGTNFPARNGGTGGNGNGGAIYNDSAGTLTLTNCTFGGNTGTGGGGGNGGSRAGGNGGIGRGAVFNRGAMTITACTVSGNSGTGGAGGTGTPGGAAGSGTGGLTNVNSATISNTLSAGNTGSAGPDSSGAFSSNGYNLIGDGTGSSGWVSSDLLNLNPQLGPLQNNGGSTDTMALSFNSPALDKGKSFGLTTDQRGFPRVADAFTVANASDGDGADIGALEFHPSNGTDSDSDGMSDNFETFYGFNPGSPSDGSLDADGDGLTNAQEYRAGTNPRDPNSGLRIIAVAKNGNDFNVTFSLAVIGKSYRLERKDAMSDTFWGSINGVADITPFLSGSSQVTDPGGASTSKRFYRVRIVP